jgi:hypothetical protein
MPALDSIMKSMQEGLPRQELRRRDPRLPCARRTIRDSRGTNANPPETQADVDAELKANVDATKDGWPRTVEFLRRV